MSARTYKALLLLFFLFFAPPGFCGDLRLEDLIAEALKNNPEILSSLSQIDAAVNRIPQAGSLPDPMVMFGYQNEGYRRYTYGEMQGAQWMFSASQTFPTAGKRALKTEAAKWDSAGAEARHEALRLTVVARVKELYFDLFLAHKSIDLIRDRNSLFAKIEDVAAGRYATGTSPQQEVLMAQAEKYMLIEKEEMFKQKIESLEAMLNFVVGREASFPLGRPAEPAVTPFDMKLEEALARAAENAPEIKAAEMAAEAAGSKKDLALKEYYPDFTLNASVFPRGGDFQDMWSMTSTINVPLYVKTRQSKAAKEAEAMHLGARYELEAAKLSVAARVRDNFAVLKTAEKLIDLYLKGLIPKNYQDFDLSLSGYATGKGDAIVAITRLKTLLDYETQYWGQRMEREKAVARLQAVIGDTEPGKRGEHE